MPTFEILVHLYRPVNYFQKKILPFQTGCSKVTVERSDDKPCPGRLRLHSHACFATRRRVMIDLNITSLFRIMRLLNTMLERQSPMSNEARDRIPAAFASQCGNWKGARARFGYFATGTSDSQSSLITNFLLRFRFVSLSSLFSLKPTFTFPFHNRYTRFSIETSIIINERITHLRFRGVSGERGGLFPKFSLL